MKKLLSKAFLLAVLTAIFLTVTAAAAEIGTGVVTGDSLRLRSGPSTSFDTIAYLRKGTEVRVLEQLDGWYKVIWRDHTGYLSASYLRFTPAGETGPRDLTGKTGVITGEQVNFRAGPSTSDEILATLAIDSQVALLELEDGWCKAVWEDQEGYVSADYVSVDGIPLADPRGVVTGDCVNIRSGPSTDYDILTQVYAGNVLQLLSLSDGWYAIEYNGVSGYIKADYVRVFTGGSAVGQAIVDKALEYLGVRYVYGGMSPKGFDCSGFTSYIYSFFDYSLPRTASGQWDSAGVSVTRAELQPGDIVVFNDPSISKGKSASHVGIYIGDGQFVHASSSKGVVISDLDGAYYRDYYKGAKRIV